MPLIPLEEALATLKSRVQPITETETVPLARAQNRTLAKDVISTVQLPPGDTSAMDGYALRVEDLNQQPPTRMKVSQRVPAGKVPTALEPGTAARLFTGSQLPPGANTVVRQEVCESINDGAEINVLENAPVNKDVRPAGQNLTIGDRMLTAGERLLPQHLGLLASTGLSEVEVFRPLKIAMFCTGDELVEPGKPLGPGQIYSSNNVCVSALVKRLGMEFVDAGLVEDDLEITKQKLKEAAAEADVVISSGGVSVGEEDHVRPAIESLGTLDLWHLAIKPGKPLAYGHINGTPFFGLPGNPVSSFVTFLILVQPYLLAMQGGAWREPVSVRVPANFTKDKAIKRQEYVRVKVVLDEQGQPRLEAHPSRDSSMIQSTTWADAFAVIPPHTRIKPGDPVETILLTEFTR